MTGTVTRPRESRGDDAAPPGAAAIGARRARRGDHQGHPGPQRAGARSASSATARWSPAGRSSTSIPGRLRLKNPVIHRKAELCQAIERELMSVLGIDHYKTNPLTCTVLVEYDPKQLTARPGDRDPRLGAGAAPSTRAQARQARPPPAALHASRCRWRRRPSSPPRRSCRWPRGLFAYTSIPTFKEARDVLFEEKRLGVDVLDAIVVVGCLGTMSIFPGAVLCWCLGFGRVLVKKTQDNSKKLLLNAFGKQPRYVWLYRDGVEVQVSLDRLQKGDVIVVNTGEVVPVDGHRRRGDGDDRPARPDRRVDAGREGGRRPRLRLDGDGRRQGLRLGREVGQRDGLGQDQPDPQRHGRLQAHLAAQGRAAGRQGGDPDPGASAPSGMATMGPAGAVAVLNSDFGTGIRMAAPLAMLSSLALCANKGILVKDGRALELMNEIDTVLFDKTGTLTRERPEVGRIIAGRRLHARADPPLRRGGRAEVPPPDRPGDPAQGRTS